MNQLKLLKVKFQGKERNVKNRIKERRQSIYCLHKLQNDTLNKKTITEVAESLLFYAVRHHGASLSVISKATICVCACVCVRYASKSVWSVVLGQIASGGVPRGTYP